VYVARIYYISDTILDIQINLYIHFIDYNIIVSRSASYGRQVVACTVE